ncbi:MAG: BatD family protein [Bacteroidales bacterium]|nr:BatD family protein [Bacteroidales bacterium]
MKRIVFCLVCWLAVAGAKSQNVTVDAAIDSLQLLIGEQAKLKIEVSADVQSKLQMPLYTDTIITGIEIVETAPADTQYLNKGKRMVVTQEYTITSWDSAFYYIPPVEAVVDDVAYHSKSLALKVLTLPVPMDEENPDAIFPAKEIRSISIGWEDIDQIVYSVLIMALLAVLAVYLYKRLKDNKPIIRFIKVEPKQPPHEVALKQMDEIKADRQLCMNNPKQYYTNLTDALRTYMSERFNFNAMEMTSTEIIGHLQAVHDSDSLKELKDLFMTSDLVKFAKYAPMLNENDMNLLNAIDFINATKQEPTPNAKTEPTVIKVEEERPKRIRMALLAGIAMSGVVLVVLMVYVVRCLLNLL